jgi:hypothetical protein
MGQRGRDAVKRWALAAAVVLGGEAFRASGGGAQAVTGAGRYPRRRGRDPRFRPASTG